MNDQLLFDFYAASRGRNADRTQRTKGDAASIEDKGPARSGDDAAGASKTGGGPGTSAAVSTKGLRCSSQAALRRGVLRWLEESRRPLGVMVGVPTRQQKYKADVAAFWSKPVSNSRGRGPSRLLVPCETLIVACYTRRDECWVDCTRAEEIIPVLARARARKADLESSIRREEPELRRPDALFEEMAEWDYDRTRNPEYRKAVKEIAYLETALVEGTKFEQIRRAEVADQLYAAVPAGLIGARELADGWGLLWVHPDLGVTVEKEAVGRPVPAANRTHLVQNIAAASKSRVLATEGVRHSSHGQAHFVKQPRMHRKAQDIHYEFSTS